MKMVYNISVALLLIASNIWQGLLVFGFHLKPLTGASRIHVSTTTSLDMLSHIPRRPIIAGNWKLNPASLSDASDLLKTLTANFVNHRTQTEQFDTCPEVVVFPPFPFLATALILLEGSGIKVGAQNVGLQTSGAFTGEVSASMLRSLGCDYVMLGHSERRALFHESDDDISKKVRLCLDQPGLDVILCVGETEEEYESDLLASVVDVQIKNGLSRVQPEELDQLVIAYEPVWAIGTGKVATPEQAQKAHEAVRKTLGDIFGDATAQRVRVQYGGSVNPENVEALMCMPDVDGALVGGASLSADSFTRIVDGGVVTQSQGAMRPRELSARECLTTTNVLGESPVWSARDQTLYWVSAPEEEVWAWNLNDPPYRRLVGSIVGNVAIRAGNTHGSVVAAAERGILGVTMSNDSTDFAAGPSVICDRPEKSETTRPNDGRVDRQGRLVLGMYNNYHRAGVSAGENNAGLYRVNMDGRIESLLDYKYRVSNGICFPASGDVMYWCDTPTRKVYSFDYPTEFGGKLTNRRLVWTMPSSLPGGPDGAQVDTEGFLWIALSGASRVVRINPTSGVIDIVVHLPVKSPTSLTFGGKDLDELFITTRGPDGGGLYRVKMPFGIKGIPEPEFMI